MQNHNFQVTDIKEGKVNKPVLISWLGEHGYKQDSFGHFQKTTSEGRYRMKLSGVMARKEVRVGDSWVRLRSGYYKKLSINEAGQLIGLER